MLLGSSGVGHKWDRFGQALRDDSTRGCLRDTPRRKAGKREELSVGSLIELIYLWTSLSPFHFKNSSRRYEYREKQKQGFDGSTS